MAATRPRIPSGPGSRSRFNMSVSVIICAYTLDRWSYLREAIASALGQTPRPDEVVLVVDRCEELLARAQDKLSEVRVVANALEPGISGARNSGVEASTGEILVFLDDDAVAHPNWLALLLAPYADPDVLGVGGSVHPDWRFGQPRWFPPEFNWVVGCSYTGMPEYEAPVRNPIGANLSMRRSVLKAVGGFDSSMGRVAADQGRGVSGTADETELCIRATKAYDGGRWMYAPAARVDHVVPESRLTWSFFVGRCRMEGGSKALLSTLAGAHGALASERDYVRRTLPLGLLREARSAVSGDGAAVLRAAAIVAGVTITAFEYARAGLLLRSRRSILA